QAGSAVAALKRADVEEPLLQRVELAVVLKALDARDAFPLASADWGNAGAGRPAFDDAGTRPAAAFAAAIFAARQVQIVPQDAEQAVCWVNIEPMLAAIDL